MTKLIYGIFIVALIGTSVLAAPTIGGPTGLLEMPTAERLQYQEYNLGIDYLGDARSINKDRDKGAHYYKLKIGRAHV